jgi:cyclophilin family peptidyl-prolyl cis-trans isomerase
MMLKMRGRVVLAFVAASLAVPPLVAEQAPAAAQKPAQPSPGAGPIIMMETSKGVIEFETYPEDAPKTVAHILSLVKRRFYNGQRIHRAEGNFVVQLGDPQTRDFTKRELWGRGAAATSGKPIGVAEISKRRTHKRGTVGMAHAGDPTQADSQFYITRRAAPELNGKYVVWGQVISGLDVVDKLQVGDVVKRISVKEPS